MDKNRLVLSISILLGCIILGGFFYASQVNKQQSIERQQEIKLQEERRIEEAKAEQEKQDQLTKELKEQEVKEQVEQALNTCIADEEENHSNFWNRECKSEGKLTNRCISLFEMTFDEYAKQNSPHGYFDFIKEKDECSCRLPLDTADRINKILRDNKDECFKKYPQK